jgi:hypothetical protein
MTARLMTREERVTVRRELRSWQVRRGDVERLLRDAVFGPGATAMLAEGIEPGVGIVVDASRDPALERAFDRRAELDDDAFLAEWQIGDRPYGRTVLCPHAPQALFAYTVSIARPVAVTRTFLLALSKTAHILTFLRKPGRRSGSCRRRSRCANGRRRASASLRICNSRALPVGIVTAPPAGLEAALAHVGFIGASA